MAFQPCADLGAATVAVHAAEAALEDARRAYESALEAALAAHAALSAAARIDEDKQP